MTAITLLNNSTQKALTTLGRLKIFLGISSDNNDQTLTLLINHITGFIEKYCDRNFLRQTYTSEIYSGNCSNQLVLRNYPVTALTSIVENQSGDASADLVTLDTDTYYLDQFGIINAFNFAFKKQPNRYQVTYQAGFLIDFDNENDITKHTLPSEIEYACLKLVSAIFNTKGAEGMSATRMGDLSVTYRPAVMADKEICQILDKYATPTI